MKTISLQEAASRTGRSHESLRRLMKQGKITGQLEQGFYGPTWQIDLDSLYAYLAPGLPRDPRAEEVRALRKEVAQLLEAVKTLQGQLRALK